MPRFERAFTVVFFLLSAGAFVYFAEEHSSAWTRTHGSPRAQMVWLTVYLLTTVLAISQYRRICVLASQDLFLLALIGTALLSISWSAVPSLTLQRGLALVGTTAFSLYLVARFNPVTLWRLLLWAFGVGAVLSLVLVLLLPSYAITTGGEWHGIFAHKNDLGRFMTLATVLWSVQALQDRRRRWLSLAFIVLSSLLVIFSQSMTSLLILAIFFMLMPVYFIRHWDRDLLLSVCLCLGIVTSGVVWGIVANAETLLGGLGRDITLTGRTYIWPVVWESVAERPWLGYGCGAFWRGWEGPSAAVWSVVSWGPGHAHNGFLDLWLQLGIVGLGLFMLSFAANFSRALSAAQKGDKSEHLLPLICLVFLLIYNMGESNLFVYNSFPWVLYVVVSLQLRTTFVPRVARDKKRNESIESLEFRYENSICH